MDTYKPNIKIKRYFHEKNNETILRYYLDLSENMYDEYRNYIYDIDEKIYFLNLQDAYWAKYLFEDFINETNYMRTYELSREV